MSDDGHVQWGVEWPGDPAGYVRTYGPNGDYTDFETANADVQRYPDLHGKVVSRNVPAWMPDPDGLINGTPPTSDPFADAAPGDDLHPLISTPLKVSLGTWKRVPGEDDVLVPTRGKEDLGYRLGLKEEADRTVVGLVNPYDPTRLTFMAYALDQYFVPAAVIARGRQSHSGRFFFDFGSNGSPMWSAIDDLEAAFERLGLLGATAEAAR